MYVFKFASFSRVTSETTLSSVFIVCCSVEKRLLIMSKAPKLKLEIFLSNSLIYVVVNYVVYCLLQ